MSGWTRNLRYDHVFAVLRIDAEDENFSDLPCAVTVVKVLWSAEAAQAETERLNRLNAQKGCTYLWQITRLVRR
jgi:hypothetical protein